MKTALGSWRVGFSVNVTLILWHNTSASPKSSSRHLRLLAHALRRLTRILRWVMNQLRWKCYLLSLVKLHSPDCECRNARETSGDEIRKRLDELSGRTQSRSLNNGDHGEAVGVFDSKPGEVISTPISLKAQQKKIA